MSVKVNGVAASLNIFICFCFLRHETVLSVFSETIVYFMEKDGLLQEYSVLHEGECSIPMYKKNNTNNRKIGEPAGNRTRVLSSGG